MKKDKSIIVGLVLCFAAVIAIAGIVTFRSEKEKPENQLAQTEEKVEEIEDVIEEPSEITQSDEVQAEIISPIEEQPPAFYFSEADLLQWPIDGNVLMSYSMDETIYFATLDQYKYNSAVIIEGKEGQEVVAAAAGKVKKIEDAVETGITVTVDIGNGFDTVYGQLGNLMVAEGDIIEQGQVLGVLAKPTRYYTVEGCNLYFQLLKKGEPMDPLDFFDV
jgi:murein DD-endopeptidase MepM/ murein hydrolase activator NlpD